MTHATPIVPPHWSIRCRCEGGCHGAKRVEVSAVVLIHQLTVCVIAFVPSMSSFSRVPNVEVDLTE